ncbi:MAG: hypothetical protein WAM17_06720, partial [Rhodoplanes sp.]
LREGRSLVPDLPLFKDKADRAVRIFDKLCVPDIEGQPPFAIAAGEWFRDIVRVIFGSLDDEGVRHVPEDGCVFAAGIPTTVSFRMLLTGHTPCPEEVVELIFWRGKP